MRELLWREHGRHRPRKVDASRREQSSAIERRPEVRSGSGTEEALSEKRSKEAPSRTRVEQVANSRSVPLVSLSEDFQNVGIAASPAADRLAPSRAERSSFRQIGMASVATKLCRACGRTISK